MASPHIVEETNLVVKRTVDTILLCSKDVGLEFVSNTNQMRRDVLPNATPFCNSPLGLDWERTERVKLSSRWLSTKLGQMTNHCWQFSRTYYFALHSNWLGIFTFKKVIKDYTAKYLSFSGINYQRRGGGWRNPGHK